MSMDDLPPIREFIRVPKLFHSVEHAAPFTRCIDCDRDLMPEGQRYLIEKAVRQGETIFEYALCLDCMERLQSSLSRESMQRIDAFYMERVDLPKRRRDLLERAGTDIEAWLAECVICRRPRPECLEYQIYGICDGPDLLFAYHPWFACGECIEEMTELFSKQTLGEIERWTNEQLGPSPHLQRLLGEGAFVPL